MEIGSRVFPIIGTNRETEKVFNPEVKDFFAPLPVGTVGGEGLTTSIPSSVAMTDVDAAGIKAHSDIATGADTGTVPASTFSFPPLKTHLNAPAETHYPNFSSFKDSVLPLANPQVETEQASEQETFDDMVVVQDGMVTSARLSDDVASGDTFEQFQSSDAHLQESQEAPSLSLEENLSDENVTPTVPQAAVEGDEDALPRDPLKASTEASIEAALAPEVEPAGVSREVTTMQEGNLEEVAAPIGSQQEQPLPGVGNTEQLSPPGVTAETNLMKVPVAVRSELPFEKPPEDQRPPEREPAVVSNEVSEQDVQAIKGQKVLKKFGRKVYVGDVIDYDPETKWFKVFYEDGDQEDLELVEVKEILAASGTSPSSKVSKRKRPRAQGATDEESNKSSKKPKKPGTEASKNNSIGRLQDKRGQQASGKRKKSPAGTNTVSKSPKSPGSMGKALKKLSELKEPKKVPADSTSNGMQEEKVESQAKPEALDSPSSKVPGKSQMVKGRKGKAKAKIVTPKSTKSGSSKSSKVVKVSRGLKVHAPESQKEGTIEIPVKSSGKKRGKRRLSLKSPGKGKKMKVTTKKLESAAKRKAVAEEIAEVKSKRLKRGFPEGEGLPSGQDINKVGEPTFIGKPVRKDFGGTLYDGVVVDYDRKWKYFKVKYDDGDKEDLEWRELELILVSEGKNVVDTEAEPVKLSSLLTLMSQKKKAGTSPAKKTKLK